MSLKITIAAAVLVLSCVALAGCDEPAAEAAPLGDALLSDWVDEQVRVHIRPDLLGMRHNVPVSVTTSTHNNAQVVLAGQLTAFDDRWVEVERPADARRHLIPREVILYIDQTH